MSFAELTPSATQLSNGVVLNYIRDGSGVPLIFIHGAMGDWRSWEPQWNAFASEFDCIAYSRRYSYPNPNNMPSPDHGAFVEAEDLGLLLDALNIERAILVGSSYGAFTALAFATLMPDRVIAIAGVEPPMMRYAEMDPEGMAIANNFREETIVPSRAAFASGNDQEGVTILTEGITASGGRRGSPPPSVMANRMKNALAAKMLALSSDEFPLIDPEKLAAISCPVFLMSGANTAPLHAAIFRNVIRNMPQAQYKIVPDAGHPVSRQQPEIFNKEVRGFLSGSLASP